LPRDDPGHHLADTLPHCPANASPAELFRPSVTGTIAKAERQIRPLLDQRRHVIQPAGTHPSRLSPNSPDFAAAHRPSTLIPGTKAAR